jgi:putative CocE/NonD family hydrolase
VNHHASIVSGVEPGQRHLNGPQTTGRQYRELSQPDHIHRRDNDVAVPTRDGTVLLADVHRPDGDGTFPVLIAASPYPRQIQDLGAPMGFIEAGASDFFVPRGYVHVIANVRGTGGSGGTYGLFDRQERLDLYDLVEWAAAQPWSNGQVGMIGISYFAMTQLAAACERPPHLRAIFPVAATSDLYDAIHHHGLFSAGFVTPFITMIGITSDHDNELWRGHLVNAARDVLTTPHIHEHFATMNGEASVTLLHRAMRLHHAEHPWDDLWRAAAVDHQVRDDWWEERNLLPLLGEVDIPVYLGCDWQNAPLHLPSTFTTLEALSNAPVVRVGLLGEFGLTWPWESLHIEALAWFDHWLKGHDTGILDGPPIRYWMPGAEQWRTAEAWPPPSTHEPWYLHSDAALTTAEPVDGEREMMTLGAGLGRVRSSPSDPPSSLTWTSPPFADAEDIVGEIELVLDAVTTASDTGWILTLQDVDDTGTVTDITAGWLRASMREVDEDASRIGRPVLPCRQPAALPVGTSVRYRIPLVPNARRINAGHRLQLHLTCDDQPIDEPALMSFRHAPVGTTSRNRINSTSHLLVPFSSRRGAPPTVG